MKKFALVFPGQGSQEVGMAGPLLSDPLSAEVFHTACDALEFDILKLISKGPPEELTLTANAQPAILATSIAAYRHLEKELDGRRPEFVAGHSLGEFSALAAAGALKLHDAVKLVRKRGELMQNAVPEGTGAMAALIGGTLDQVRELIHELAEDGILDIANINAPGQVVVSGTAHAVQRAVENGREFGFKRAIPLQVSAPFHSRMMGPVREKFSLELEKYEIGEPFCHIIHNVTAEPNGDPRIICDMLAKQIDSPVLWVESVNKMLDNGVEVFIEVGHGNVLQGLVKKICGREFEGSIIGCSNPEEALSAVGELQ